MTDLCFQFNRLRNKENAEGLRAICASTRIVDALKSAGS